MGSDEELKRIRGVVEIDVRGGRRYIRLVEDYNFDAEDLEEGSVQVCSYPSDFTVPAETGSLGDFDEKWDLVAGLNPGVWIEGDVSCAEKLKDISGFPKLHAADVASADPGTYVLLNDPEERND